MIKIIRGRYGANCLGPGSVISLDAASEKRLIDRKVAVAINPSKEENDVNNQEDEEIINDPENYQELDNQEDEVIINDSEDCQELDNQEGEIEVFSESDLNKIRSKRELIEYAESIGLTGLEESAKKEELVNDILNYTEEHFDVE